ncbi:hypothetical protein ACFYQA_13105 [Streptomyces sp. NPDC005774]|uniref:hypothetical protein n=1 Tax=Streptomyces sp. NPDC005774 TaxID=3364728 RepID=UPI00369C30DE
MIDITRVLTCCRSADWACTVRIDDSYAVLPATSPAIGGPTTRTIISTRCNQNSTRSDVPDQGVPPLGRLIPARWQRTGRVR